MLNIYFFDIGQGDCTLIRFPNGTTMLIDCYIPSDSFLEKIDDQLPVNDEDVHVLDYLLITHPHEDHILGIGKLAERYKIKNILESGHRLYIESKDKEKYTHYYDMLDLIQKVKRNGGIHVKLKAYDVVDITDEPDVLCSVLSPTKAYLADEKPTERDIHDQCAVFRIEYKGRSVLFTGDSSMEAWKERIVPYYSDDSGRPNLLKSTILHVSHHGSYTFFKPKGKNDEEAYINAILKIEPSISIISVGDGNRHGHPDEDALELYEKYTFNKQVYMTKDHNTLFVDINDDGNYSIVTEKMIRSSKRLNIASVKIDVSPKPKDNGLYDKGVKLYFKAIFTKLSTDQKVKDLTWIVQNNAIGDDEHHDWYIGQIDASKLYENHTAYPGNHILLLEVRNQRGNLIATRTNEVKIE